MKKKLPAFVVLLAITLIAGLVLGGTYTITKDPIAAETARKMEEARSGALPEADTFRKVFEVTGDGIFGSATEQGKIGPVYVEVQMQPDGTITDLVIGDENYAETPEYAAKVQEDAFKAQFIGKKAPFAIIAATEGSDTAVQTYTASVNGFAGPVAVTAAFDGDKIVSFAIGDEKFAESEGYGKKALDPAFAKQFEGKKMPLELGDIDAISGATITSTAVVNAANKAYSIANATPVDAVSGATVTSEAVVEAINSAAATDSGMDWCYEGLKDGQVVGYVAQTNVKGFGGKVEVIVGVNRDQKITGISVGGANFSETAGLGAKAKEADFTRQFIGKDATESIGVIKAGNSKGDNDVDAITAATITSSAVAGGVNSIATFVNQLLPASADANSSATSDANSSATTDANSSATSDAGTSATTDANSSATSDAGTSATTDTNSSATSDAGTSATTDANSSATSDAGTSATTDANSSATSDADPAATTDTSSSATSDADTAATTGAASVDTPDTSSSATSDADTAAITVAAPADTPDADPAATTDTSSSATSDADPAATTGAAPDTGVTVPSSAPEAPVAAVTGAVFTGTAKGNNNSPIAVTVTFDHDGKITSLTIGDDRFNEKENGKLVLKPEFAQQFIGKQAPLTMDDIQIINGAEVSCEAVINAINKAYKKFIGQ